MSIQYLEESYNTHVRSVIAVRFASVQSHSSNCIGGDIVYYIA
jgi:hypothetical protein